MLNTANPLIYTGNSKVPEGVVRISPSGFNTFVTRPHQWYAQTILKKDLIQPTTAMLTGSLIHLVAEYVALNKPIKHEMIVNWVAELEDNIDTDKEAALLAYKAPAEELVVSYVLNQDNSRPIVEQVLKHWLTPKVLLSGSIDRIEGTQEDAMIVDYKSYGSTTKPKAIPQNYKYQLLLYAFLANKNGYKTTRVRLVYVNREIDKRTTSEKTGKPIGKIYPPEVTVLTESITQEDIDFISGLLDLCVAKLEATEKHHDLTGVIWHDPRLL